MGIKNGSLNVEARQKTFTTYGGTTTQAGNVTAYVLSTDRPIKINALLLTPVSTGASTLTWATAGNKQVITLGKLKTGDESLYFTGSPSDYAASTAYDGVLRIPVNKIMNSGHLMFKQTAGSGSETYLYGVEYEFLDKDFKTL